jgi:uncharacterized membrane protein YcgQ (UPF0703/DUF1980 family)
MRKNKLIIAVITAIAASFVTLSCFGTKKAEVTDNKVVEINEKMFVAQVNDVYLNAKDYLGKTIKLEGIFKSEQNNEKEEPYRFVLRYGLGCCGDDGNVGFEVTWSKEKEKPYPSVDEWVEAIGVLKVGEKANYLYLDLASLNVLETRGREIVFQ